ncbi:hypothetical protein NUU61_003447 [Penicillium alfredii]|uniref:Uncharacterized protein n=1 Tax=Penicillium alfredii TaxID=1506179 RepID=A0A9W9FU26_9EURO|nr:uncharacterized protein NUU61_003447 [Penicillium alfredii]KAJ5106100.1 hypothetical protein NUU61_003447 [Penicillium alfredii]
MSTASIKDHANTMLNLLDMERGPQQEAWSLSRFVNLSSAFEHPLTGFSLVLFQALLNAKEDPKYNSIWSATWGLVFFGTSHRGAKAVELGKIASRVARFVSKGNASNDLLDCLEHNSLFTRQMTDRFWHHLEDYRVVSFIEGKAMQLGGTGPVSLVVDEESAVMCKVGSRGPMYRLIKGNTKQLVDQALLSEQGFIPRPTLHPAAGSSPPPLPPRTHSNSSTPYQGQGRMPPAVQRVIGTIFTQLDNDPRSIRAAELKDRVRWDEARTLAYEIFQEHLGTLGADHFSTLSVGYNLAEVELESNYLGEADEWCQWVSDNAQRVFGSKHALAMKTEILMAEILCQQSIKRPSRSVPSCWHASK